MFHGVLNCTRVGIDVGFYIFFIRTRPWNFLDILKVPVFYRYLQVQIPKKATFRIQIKRFFHICFHKGIIPLPFHHKINYLFHSLLFTYQSNAGYVERSFFMRKCKVIAVTNQKGGVGKTTTTANVAIGLERYGYKVLIVDFDPQGDLTTSLGWKSNDALDCSVSNLLDAYINDKEINFSSLILKHKEDVDVIPANIELADMDIRLVSVINREQTLSSCIEPLRDDYDFILIDCPPSLGMLTINALSAADEVLIPVQAQFLPAKGMTQLLQTVSKVQRKINTNLKVAGIVMTLVDMNTTVAKSTIETIHESFGKNIRVFDTIIPKATKASEATIAGVSIYAYAKDSKVAKAYDNLTMEIISEQKVKHKDRDCR